jgi:hypothetical protein
MHRNDLRRTVSQISGASVNMLHCCIAGRQHSGVAWQLTLSFRCSCGWANGFDCRGSIQLMRPNVSPACNYSSWSM